MNQNATIIVGMSGGVDSSVSALLLKQKGYRVIGLYMKNWEEINQDGICSGEQDFDDVRQVCEQIGIPYYTANFTEQYRRQVFDEFIKDLQEGLTPNPDILCNREIKFKVFLNKAKELGADFLATGHYAQVGKRSGKSCLLRGQDHLKDQTYFLYALTGEILNHVIFPIGHLEKSEVRHIARQFKLPTSEKKDSTGICFIGERHFRPFVSQYIGVQPGNFETPDGKIVGQHQGTALYTIGQRKGMGIGGPGAAWYVVGKDIERRVIYVEQGADHPALFCNELRAHKLSWITDPPPHFPFKCQSKVRYRQIDQPCEIQSIENGIAHITFPIPQRAVTPGQSIVFYAGSECLGGGVIATACV